MKSITVILLFLLATIHMQAQKVLDEVVAIVGNEVILLSDVESPLVQYKDISSSKTGQARCLVVDQLMQKKLLLNRAKIDSLKISDEQVEGELARRMEFFIQQYGSEDAIEKYYHKTILQIKDDFREAVKQQLLQEQEQSKVVGDAEPTPEEIKKYYKSISKDSLPYYNTEFEIGEILMYPQPTKKDKQDVITKLQQMRQDILAGKTSFNTQAILYSEDVGSAIHGGDLGWQHSDQFVPEFSAVALSLKKDSISDPFETKYGFHIAQLMERKGDLLHVRHILRHPVIGDAAVDRTKSLLDSVRTAIIGSGGKKDSIFNAMAYKFSQDDDTKNRGGMMVDMKTSSSHIPVDELDAVTFDAIDKMQIGEISQPLYYKTKEGKMAYRILYLKSKNAPHKANLVDDYPKIKQLAEEDKKAKALDIWVKKYIPLTYIYVTPNYKSCANLQKWYTGTVMSIGNPTQN